MHTIKDQSGSLALGLAVLMALIFIVAGCIEIVWYIQFERKCEGYLKRAADANTVELATKELTRAIKYLEDNEMTKGYTSVIYTTPDEDIEFFYTNLKKSLEELQTLPPNATGLEKSNMLIKLRETLLDMGKSTEVTCPTGLSRYPYNGLMAVVLLASLVMCIVFGAVYSNEY